MNTTDQTITAQEKIRKDFRWNFIVNMLDGTSYWFGVSFMSIAVILPLYVSHFTDNPILIGLIPFFGTAGYLVPQLFAANVVERAPVKKFFPVTLGFFLMRLPILLLAPAAFFLATNQPTWALLVFFLLYAWHTIGTGWQIVGYQDMIAKIIPVDKRGRFFGITNFMGNGMGILGALAVPVVLSSFSFPQGFVISFAIAGVLIFFSWFFLSLTREPAVQSNKPPVSQWDYFRSLPQVLRKDHNLRMYLLAQILFALNGMATGFLVVYAVKTWNMSDAQASGFTIAMQVGLALANLFFGFLADRKGHKLNLEICMILSTLGLLVAVVAPSPLWFFLIFFMRGAIGAGTYISGVSIVYEFTDAENRATYIGLANTIPGIMAAVAPLIGGWFAGAVSYQAMFIVAAVFGVISWAVFRFAVREPRHMKVEPRP